MLDGLSTFTSNADLKAKVRSLYERLDIDESGGIDLEEFNVGLRRLQLPHLVRLSADDFMDITQRGKLLNDKKELTPAAFENMMLTQFKKYAQRKTVYALSKLPENDSEILFAIKMLASQVEHLATHGSDHHSDVKQGDNLSKLGGDHMNMAPRTQRIVLDRIKASLKGILARAFKNWQEALGEECNDPETAPEKVEDGGGDSSDKHSVPPPKTPPITPVVVRSNDADSQRADPHAVAQRFGASCDSLANSMLPPEGPDASNMCDLIRGMSSKMSTLDERVVRLGDEMRQGLAEVRTRLDSEVAQLTSVLTKVNQKLGALASARQSQSMPSQYVGAHPRASSSSSAYGSRVPSVYAGLLDDQMKAASLEQTTVDRSVSQERASKRTESEAGGEQGGGETDSPRNRADWLLLRAEARHVSACLPDASVCTSGMTARAMRTDVCVFAHEFCYVCLRDILPDPLPSETPRLQQRLHSTDSLMLPHALPPSCSLMRCRRRWSLLQRARERIVGERDHSIDQSRSRSDGPGVEGPGGADAAHVMAVSSGGAHAGMGQGDGAHGEERGARAWVRDLGGRRSGSVSRRGSRGESREPTARGRRDETR